MAYPLNKMMSYVFLLFASVTIVALWFASSSSPTDATCPREEVAVVPMMTPSPSPSPAPVGIPRLLHWAYAQPPSGKPLEVSFIKWLSMSSAVYRLRPELIMVHTEAGRLPRGFWWDLLVQKHGDIMRVVEHNPVTSIYGHPVDVMAHKTDVLRLDAVYTHGGVYVDSDVLVFTDFLESVNEHLRLHPEQDAVLAAELDGSVSYGNAVIMARPFSKFIALWRRGYHDFNDTEWSRHSTAYPRVLNQEHPGLLHLLPNTAFYEPAWMAVAQSVQILTGRQDYKYEQVNALGWHWWGHLVEPWLGPFTPCTVRTQPDTMVVRRLVGHLVTEELCSLWRANTTATEPSSKAKT